MRYQYLPSVDPQTAGYIEGEERRQAYGLELIASENFVSEAVLEARRTAMAISAADEVPEQPALTVTGGSR